MGQIRVSYEQVIRERIESVLRSRLDPITGCAQCCASGGSDALVFCQHFMVGLGGWRLNVVKPQRYGLGHRKALPPATPILSFDKDD